MVKAFQAVQIKQFKQIKQNKCRSSRTNTDQADCAGEMHIKHIKSFFIVINDKTSSKMHITYLNNKNYIKTHNIKIILNKDKII